MERARAALERAEAQLAEAGDDDVKRVAAESARRRAENRLRVADRGEAAPGPRSSARGGSPSTSTRPGGRPPRPGPGPAEVSAHGVGVALPLTTVADEPHPICGAPRSDPRGAAMPPAPQGLSHD